MAFQLIGTSGVFAGEESAISTPRKLPATASNDAIHGLLAAVRREAFGSHSAHRISFRRGLVLRIRLAVLELGEYLRPPFSTISAFTGVCDRMATWAGSDGRHWLDAAPASAHRRSEANGTAVEQPSLQVDARAQRSLLPQHVTCEFSSSSKIRL
jgi:hypothetical protein